MSFTPNIPNVTDFLSLSQKQILANFQAISNSFFINHVSLTADEDNGRHNSLTLRPQGGDPTTSVTQCAFYNKLDGSSQPQLFFRGNSNATPIQMSNSNLNTLQTGASNGTQSSFLAGPFTIYVGFVLFCPNNQVVTLSPSSTLIYVGVSTSLNSPALPLGPNVSIPTLISGNQFTIRYPTTMNVSPTLPTIYYMAIGK